MKRREFMVGLGLGTLALGAPWPALAAPWPALAGQPRRMLIAVHLVGGNDGLNTVVPWDAPAYRRARPSLALRSDEVSRLRPGLGLHAALSPLLPLWERGQMAIVNGVGYPSPSHSHFRSTEIWQTACVHGASDEGWLGRWLDGRADRVGVNVDAMLAQALWSSRNQPICVRSRDQFRLPSVDAAYSQALDSMYRGASSAHVRRTYGRLRQTMRDLERGSTADLDLGAEPDDFAKNLDALLSMVPQGGVYHTSVGGFDTHGGQKERQAKALASMARGLAALWKDLQRRHLANDTLILVYSEFGRRVEENASGGTDHGTAGPLFLIGTQVKGGLHGEYPSLVDTDEGDLRYLVDFRNVYATILERWLHTESAPILGNSFPTLALLR